MGVRETGELSRHPRRVPQGGRSTSRSREERDIRRHPFRLYPGALGEIVYAHYRDDAERLRVAPAELDAIARLGGDTCATIRDRFEMPTPRFADWEAARGGPDTGKS